MSTIWKQDTDGVKPLLGVGELGYDNYPDGGDAGRVYVGKGTENVALATAGEVTELETDINTTISTLETEISNSISTLETEINNSISTLETDINTTITSIENNVTNLQTTVIPATTEVAGITRLATTTEATEGTSDSIAITPAGLSSALADGTLTTKVGTSTVGSTTVPVYLDSGTVTTTGNTMLTTSTAQTITGTKTFTGTAAFNSGSITIGGYAISIV